MRFLGGQELPQGTKGFGLKLPRSQCNCSSFPLITFFFFALKIYSLCSTFYELTRVTTFLVTNVLDRDGYPHEICRLYYHNKNVAKERQCSLLAKK